MTTGEKEVRNKEYPSIKEMGPDQDSSSTSGGGWPRLEKCKAQAFETSLCGGEGKGSQEGKSEIVGSKVSPLAMASVNNDRGKQSMEHRREKLNVSCNSVLALHMRELGGIHVGQKINFLT